MPVRWAARILLLLLLLLPVGLLHGEAAAPARALPAPSQDHAPGSVVRFEHLTLLDGLSQNAGLVLFQDSRGFLWIGTQDGLNRYDGYAFAVFRHDPANPASLSHNRILSIAEDREGFLWVGTWGGGLNRFDPSTETFQVYRHHPDDPASLSDDTVTSLLKDSSGALWAGTLNGLNRLKPQARGFDRFGRLAEDPSSLSSNVISVIFEDSRRQLWVGTGALGQAGGGLNRFNPENGKVTRFQHRDDDPTSLASDNISAIYEAPDGNFWVGTGGYELEGAGLDLFNPRTGTAFHYPHDEEIEDTLGGNNIAALWGDSGALWIGTRSSGLDRMDFSHSGHFTHYQHDPFFPDSLSGDHVWSLFKDRSGILWIGTANSGLNKLPANSGQFNLYRNNPSNPHSLGTNNVGTFSEDQYGRIWVGTWGGGLDRFDPQHGSFEHFRHEPSDRASLSNDLVTSVYADAHNVVWAGTLGGGLNRIELTTGEITRYRHDPRDPTSLIDDNVTVIISDGQRGLWLGTFGGLSHYDPAADEFTNYVSSVANNPVNLASLSEDRIVSLYLDDSERVLWAGTLGGGLNLLDLEDPYYTSPQLAAFRTYRYNSDDPTSLSEDTVWSILKSADGYLWLGTQSGLNRFDPRSQTFQRYTEEQGLANDSVFGILDDDQGDLWLTTNNGLSKLDRRAGTFTNYDVTDGLQSNEFNSNAYFRSRDGTLYIGGVNGFNTFRPEHIRPNPVPPRVALTRFEIFNDPQILDRSGGEQLRLSYRQNFLTFEFVALDFGAPENNQYAYMLQGFDQDWIPTHDSRSVTYTDLPAGEYIFRVKASNGDGIWNEDGVSLPIRITPPLWETWWFRGLGIAVLGALTVLSFRWRLRAIRAQKAALEQQVALRTAELQHQIAQREKAEEALAEKAAQEAVSLERTRLARDLHDAVTQTLFSASLIADVLPDLWSLNQAEGWKRLEELRQLTRGALAEMRTLLVELRPNALTEVPLPDLLRQLCESLIGRSRLPIQFCGEGRRRLPADVQICFYRITQEALNNILKHARATQAVVRLHLDENASLSILDNGCGFDFSAVTADHLGLKIMCERAEAIGAKFSVCSQPGEGTQIVVLWVPPSASPRPRADEKASEA